MQIIVTEIHAQGDSYLNQKTFVLVASTCKLTYSKAIEIMRVRYL